MYIQAFSYKMWADERILAAIKAIDRNTFSEPYSFALQQINHIVIVEELFQSRLTNRPAPHCSTNTDVVPAFSELSKRLIDSGSWYLDFVPTYQSGEKAISFTFADGQRGRMTVDEILFHVLNHGAYHRGNIAHALDLASVPHPIDGYGIYIHEKEPERRNT